MNTKIEEKSEIDILMEFEEHRKKVFSDLLSEVDFYRTLIDKVFPMDYGCTYDSGGDYICKNCHLVDFLFDGESKTYPDGSIIPFVDTLKISHCSGSMMCDITPGSIFFSENVNSFIQNVIIENALSKNMIMCHKIYHTFRCNDKIFSIQDEYPYIRCTDIENVIIQLIFIYDILDDISFSGIVYLGNLVRIRKGVKFGKHRMPFTLSFNDFSRFTTVVNELNILPLKEQHSNSTNVVNLTLYKNGTRVFSYDSFDTLVFNDQMSTNAYKSYLYTLKHLRFINFYYTLISILMDPDMRTNFFESVFLRNLWNKIWKSSSSFVMEKLVESSCVEDVLTKVPLKRNILRKLINVIST